MAKQTTAPQAGATNETETLEPQAGAPVTSEPANVKLSVPKIMNIVGTIVGLSSRQKGGKFEHDTHIVTLENVKDGTLFDIFITAKQYKEYGCAKYCYMDNIINVEVEQCIENVTGYIAEEGDLELTPHEATFNAFHRALNASIPGLTMQLGRMDLQFQIVESILRNLSIVRQAHDRASAGDTGASPIGFLG